MSRFFKSSDILLEWYGVKNVNRNVKKTRLPQTEHITKSNNWTAVSDFEQPATAGKTRRGRKIIDIRALSFNGIHCLLPPIISCSKSPDVVTTCCTGIFQLPVHHWAA
jgi:hypothetical protein